MTQTQPAPAGPDHADQAALPLQLEFLRVMGAGEAGPFGPRYTIVVGWRLLGTLDESALAGALHDVVARHEALRTEVVLGETEACQVISPPSSPDLSVRELGEAPARDRDEVVEEFLNAIESGVHIGPGSPRLRAVVGRFTSKDAVLVLVAHHSVVDGFSMQVLQRDLLAFYQARRAGRPAQLPPARQFREYVDWQREQAASPSVAASLEFWRQHLDGARVLPMPTDRPRSADSFVTGWHRFMLEDDFRTATLRVARETRSSPFMVLMAAFMTVLRDRTGETDLVVPTLTTGRTPAWTQDVIGVFYNFMPIRADLSGCDTFPEIVARVRAACLATYPHELPFLQVMSVAPELMSLAMQANTASVAFQIIQHGADHDSAGLDDLEITAIRRRVVSTPVGSQIPDGILAELDLHPDGGMFGKVAFARHLYDESTVTGLMADLRQVLLDHVVCVKQS